MGGSVVIWIDKNCVWLKQAIHDLFSTSEWNSINDDDDDDDHDDDDDNDGGFPKWIHRTVLYCKLWYKIPPPLVGTDEQLILSFRRENLMEIK